MAIQLYDLSVATYLQTTGAVERFLQKGLEYCNENSIDLNDVVETRLYEDMLPFRFQIISVVHHSLGAIQGAEAGKFLPPPDLGALDYVGLQSHLSEAQAALQAYTPESVNALDGKDMVFSIGGREIPFTVENFILSFSMPNFFFHATTAYDILRGKGVPLGKRDFLGAMRIKR
jgi:hypothetical protein